MTIVLLVILCEAVDATQQHNTFGVRKAKRTEVDKAIVKLVFSKILRQQEGEIRAFLGKQKLRELDTSNLF